MFIIRRGLLLLPLAGALWSLRWLPTIAATPLQGASPLGWYFDPLTHVFVLLLALGVAPLQLGWRDTLRVLAAVGLLVPALLAEHLLALPITLVLVSGLLKSWRWFIASVVLLIALGLLLALGGAGWHGPHTATLITSPIFLLLLAACCIGLGIYPAAIFAQAFDPLRLMLQPLWLLPLLRAIAWGPWNTGWALATLLLGLVATLWACTTALWGAPSRSRVDHIANTWLSMALTCIGLLTPVGISAALWLVLSYPLSLGLLLRGSRWRWWAAPLPPTAMFTACWLVQGALAASGTLLAAAVCWLATLLSGLAVLREHTEQPSASTTSPVDVVLLGLALGLGVLVPLPLRWLVIPAVELLQGGLTPFGLLDIWPWVGIAALDAGQRRVAVLPSIAVAVLMLVVAALVWLLARIFGWIGNVPPDTAHNAQQSAELWTSIQQRVWWAKGPKRRG